MKSLIFKTTLFFILFGAISLITSQSFSQALFLKSGSFIEKRILRGQVQGVQVIDTRGSLQWQQSIEGISWQNLPGRTGNSLSVFVNEIIFLRCAITEANCDPVYSDVLKIIPIDLATIATTTISAIAQTTATGGGNVINDGGATISTRGICWSMSQNPTTANSKTIDGSGVGIFTSNLIGITANTTYYVRAYAINIAGTSYGNQVSFTTLKNIVAPTVTTTAISAIAQTTSTGGGNVTNDGGATVSARGICWSTTSNPTTANSKTTNGTGTGTFISSLTGLTANTLYYVRAYAINSAGTSYGVQVSFTTLQNISIPTVSTNFISAIAQTTATGGGNVTNDGGATISARGICWSMIQNPTTANSKTFDGTGVGSFTSNLTGLTANSTYYVRAYAINSAGTSYGDQVSFTTLQIIAKPTVTTTNISAITPTTASGGGNVTNSGGAMVSDRGICWSTSTSPSISDSKTTDGTGTGAFTSSLTGLIPNTTYYVRAYATNSGGTSYGAEVSFLSVLTTISIFLANGSMIVPESCYRMDYLIVAGGGSGGKGYNGFGEGGGGAGGYLAGTVINPVAGSYPVIVGAGGSNASPGKGGSSSFYGMSAVGGGSGAWSTSTQNYVAQAGGSGGGGGFCPNTSPVYSTIRYGGLGTAGQGHDGCNESGNIPGGGGGAGGTPEENSYHGGPGISNSISGSAVVYSAGGSVQRITDGISHNGVNGNANTGNGGQGAGSIQDNIQRIGGSGGSGIIIIKLYIY